MCVCSLVMIYSALAGSTVKNAGPAYKRLVFMVQESGEPDFLVDGLDHSSSGSKDCENEVMGGVGDTNAPHGFKKLVSGLCESTQLY